MIIDTTKAFVENELYPHENEIEQTGILRPDLKQELKRKAIEAGLYAANMPEEAGGAGLDTLTWVLYERELGRANYALHWTCVARPSNILMACVGEQRERYHVPSVRGEKSDCLAMTEPGAGSDVRGMKCSAVKDGTDFIINAANLLGLTYEDFNALIFCVLWPVITLGLFILLLFQLRKRYKTR